jgi:5-methyltetrahydropteroyltriglutamate--homocysteine methyltransferase
MPRIAAQPGVEEMTDLLAKASKKLDAVQIWINPDCSLKTRKWEEVRPALVNMVQAAKRMRSAAHWALFYRWQ